MASRLGKLKESAAKRSVFRPFDQNEYGSPAWGEDAGLFSLPSGDGAFGAVCTFTEEGSRLLAERAASGLMNRLTAAGAEPLAASLALTLPEEMEERALREISKQLNLCCREAGMPVVSLAARFSPFASDVIVSAAGFGAAAGEAARKTCAGKCCDIVAAGSVGTLGAAMLAAGRREELLARYAERFLAGADALAGTASLHRLLPLIRREDVYAAHAVCEGGVFAGLWELAAAAKVGLDVELKAIPIRQHTIEICEYFNLNPYQLYSGGCILLLCERGREVEEELSRLGCGGACIGRATDSNDRIIRYDDEVRYLEPPKMDEIYKVF